MAAFNFYDDKYGFEPSTTCRSAFQVAQRVHFWLGAQFDAKKLQLSEEPTILGVTYDLRPMCLRIKPSRKEELHDEIDSILYSALLPPGQAGKLRGKLAHVWRLSALGQNWQGFLEIVVGKTIYQTPSFGPEQGSGEISRILEVADTTWSAKADHDSISQQG